MDEVTRERDELAALQVAKGGWGARKRAYYGGGEKGERPIEDEEGEIVDDEEAIEAARQHKLSAAEMEENDFGIDDFDDEDASGNKIEVEEVIRDPTKLSKNERLRILAKESPELIDLLKEFRTSISQLKDQLEPLLTRVRSSNLVTEEGLSYLEAEGSTVKDHPVVGRLVELRALLERMKPLDRRLKYQIDKLLKAASLGVTGAVDQGQSVDQGGDALQYRARASALVQDGDEERGEEERGESEEEIEEEGEDEVKVEPYRPPHIAAAPYPDASRDRKRVSKRARKSQIAQDIVEEFSERPVLIDAKRVASDGVEYEESDGEKDRRRYEEEHFVRITESKQDRKKREKKKRERRVEEESGIMGIDDILTGLDADTGLDAVYDAAKKTKKKRREEQDTSIPFRGREEESVEGKRGVNWAMMKNKGLTGGKKQEIPRVKHKKKFKKAVIKRRTSGLSRETKAQGGAYGGERTGIKSRSVRSTKIRT